MTADQQPAEHMRILQFTAENVKRLSVVQITPEGNLVQITGANGQGKTSVLDAIWMALGGKDAMPEKPIRKGAAKARVEVTLGDSAGVKLVVERTFTDKGTYLTVRGADGAKYGSPQKMLDDLMGHIGFDPLAFMRMNGKEQFDLLRRVVKMAVDIDVLNRQRATIFEDRTNINRDLASAQARAAAIVVPDDLPEEEPDRQAIVKRLGGVSEHNANITNLHRARENADRIVEDAALKVARAEEALATAQEALNNAKEDHAHWITQKDTVYAAEIPEPLDPAAITAELADADRIAAGFRAQASKITATTEVETYQRRATEKTRMIEEIDAQKAEALATAKMPIEGLTFEDGTVSFNGLPLTQASASQQLRVSAAIGAALNPKLGVILARDGSLLDSKSLVALADFAKEKGMQIFLERVDESGEVGIVMEDGHVKGQEELVAQHEKTEAEAAASPTAAAAQTQRDPGGDADARARSYLDSMVKALPNHRTPEEAEAANAQVKVKLARFPNLISTEWVPAYLRTMQALTKKK